MKSVDPEFLAFDPTRNLVPQALILPGLAFEYLSALGTTITTSGDQIRLNLPKVARLRTRDDENDTLPGFFGPCNGDSHNTYECTGCQ